MPWARSSDSRAVLAIRSSKCHHRKLAHGQFDLAGTFERPADGTKNVDSKPGIDIHQWQSLCHPVVGRDEHAEIGSFFPNRVVPGLQVGADEGVSGRACK
jgi:hypothetical protein